MILLQGHSNSNGTLFKKIFLKINNLIFIYNVVVVRSSTSCSKYSFKLVLCYLTNLKNSGNFCNIFHMQQMLLTLLVFRPGPFFKTKIYIIEKMFLTPVVYHWMGITSLHCHGGKFTNQLSGFEILKRR